jgi:hypothetical protein
VDVNLTPVQPHHKIEKGKNKRERKSWDVNMIPKMWGWTQLLGNVPRWCTLGLYPATSSGWEPKKHSRKIHASFGFLFIYLFSLNYFIIA